MVAGYVDSRRAASRQIRASATRIERAWQRPCSRRPRWHTRRRAPRASVEASAARVERARQRPWRRHPRRHTRRLAPEYGARQRRSQRSPRRASTAATLQPPPRRPTRRLAPYACVEASSARVETLKNAKRSESHSNRSRERDLTVSVLMSWSIGTRNSLSQLIWSSRPALRFLKNPLPQVHRSSEPWTHTLARVCGDSRAAVNHNSTMCESARAQVRPKITSSYHCLAESRFAIQKSPVGSTPIGDYSVVRALCVWMVATSTAFGSRYPGQARVRRR